jgi:drug/metabolite transporter (DMT)-like permease
MGVLAITVFGERPTWRLMAAITIAALGVLLITLRMDADGVSLPSLNDAIGISILLLAVACEVLFLLLNKKLATPVSALALSTLMSVFGLVLAVGPATIEMATGAAQNVTGAAILGVVYYALIPTILGFVLWYEGAARTSASEAALFTAILPISALALASLVLGEPVTIQQGLGCGCVVLAILVGVVQSAPPPSAD